MEKFGRVVILDGLNGSGKTTTAKELHKIMVSAGHFAHLCRDPGDTRGSEAIRKIVKDPEIPMLPLTQMLLYTAARSELSYRLLPFVRAGENVILDRWWPSTYAYQGANNVEPDMIMSLMRSTTPPEFRGDNVLMFYLSLPIETAMQRSGVFSQGGGPETGNDRFEKEGVEFQRKLEARYRILVLMGLMREVRVDQFSSEKETAEFLWHNYIEQELA